MENKKNRCSSDFMWQLLQEEGDTVSWGCFRYTEEGFTLRKEGWPGKSRIVYTILGRGKALKRYRGMEEPL